MSWRFRFSGLGRIRGAARKRRSELHLPRQRAILRAGADRVYSRQAGAVPNESQQYELANHRRNVPRNAAAFRSLLHCVLAAAILFAAQAIGFTQAALAKDSRGGDFDYYALALSWSPTFCQTPAGEDADLQCNSQRRYDFVVHGLCDLYLVVLG
jgi:hypothetical protein